MISTVNHTLVARLASNRIGGVIYGRANYGLLIPPRTQYGATRSKVEQRKPLRYAAIAIPCTPLQHMTDHS
jgi:hypothetical protein